MKPFSSALALALSLISRPAAAAGDRDIVKVNGTTIRQSEVMEKLWQRYGPDTLEEMIDDLLLRQEAQKRNIKPESSEVDRRLARLKEQLPDPKLLETQLAQNGSSIDKLKQDIGDQVALEKLIAGERKLSIKDEELKQAFDKHKDELGRPEAVHLRHIMVSTEAEADDVIKHLNNGADFKALAREKSLAPTGKMNGGDYGFVTRGILPPDIEEVAFGMKMKDLKKLQSGKGWHILQALERRAAEPAVYAKVKEDLRQALLEEKIKAALPEYKHQLRAKAEIQPLGS
jgi:foldase protein PrsA